jgi:hypothetical protein
MREICTYGLNEGLLARAFRTAGWGLLHHGRMPALRSQLVTGSSGEFRQSFATATVIAGAAADAGAEFPAEAGPAPGTRARS